MSSQSPLVTVICLCYNHERFVVEAIQSVHAQTYGNIQLIVVDDHSTDGSVDAIKSILKMDTSIESMFLEANLGNCRAFNLGFVKARGEFIVDLAADDILVSDRIEKGIRAFEKAGQAGVNFTDAVLIDESGHRLGLHSDRFPHSTIPQGDVYRDVLSRYFINSPTMMMRRSVFEKLGGYDETLAYEDFDFWVRSARHFNYCYTPEPLVKRRIIASSLGQKQYTNGSVQLNSTLRVCEKAHALNKTPDENQALRKRVRYEMRRALQLGELRIAWNYLNLFLKI